MIGLSLSLAYTFSSSRRPSARSSAGCIFISTLKFEAILAVDSPVASLRYSFDAVGQTYRQRDDRKCWRRGSCRGKDGRASDEEIRYAMDATVPVNDASCWIVTHPRGSHVMPDEVERAAVVLPFQGMFQLISLKAQLVGSCFQRSRVLASLLLIHRQFKFWLGLAEVIEVR